MSMINSKSDLPQLGFDMKVEANRVEGDIMQVSKDLWLDIAERLMDSKKPEGSSNEKEVKVNENYTERLVNAVAKTLVEAFENLTIEDINMYQCGYNKAITELKNKICMHFADWQYSEDDKVIKDIIELASEAVDEIAEEMRSVTGSSQEG